MEKIVNFARPFIFQPLSWKSNGLPSFRKKNHFFLSFADALLCILKEYQIAGQKEYVLLPTFYCPDTIEFFRKYLKIIFYKINNDFTVDKNHYFKQIKDYKPRIIVNYNFLGVAFAADEKSQLINLINDSTIIIEDCAHRILLDSEISFINKNHFYLDSIRKYSPFLGCHLINNNFSYSSRNVAKVNWYKIKFHSLQLIKGGLDFFSYLFNLKPLLREKIFFLMDDLIGTHHKSTLGCSLSFYLYNFLNLKKIKKHHQQLALCYNDNFNQLKTPLIKTITHDLIIRGELCYYPLVVFPEIQPDLIRYLWQKNIYGERLWDPADLTDQEIDKDFYESFIILPLNYLVKEKDALRVCQEIKNFFDKNDYFEPKTQGRRMA